MAENHQLGQSGEQMAANFLKKNGYTVLETNWRQGPLEVDIIARKENILVIAEVKTRSTNVFGEPEEFVTRQKQKNLIRAANFYIIENNLDVEARFDILSVLHKGNTFKIYHIEDAFYPTL
jgi:putative endonuclease